MSPIFQQIIISWQFNYSIASLSLPLCSLPCSWLHSSDACLVEVRAAPEGEDQEQLTVKVLLTAPTLRKFVSKFADNITMTAMAQQDSLELTAKNRKLGLYNL